MSKWIIRIILKATDYLSQKNRNQICVFKYFKN